MKIIITFLFPIVFMHIVNTTPIADKARMLVKELEEKIMLVDPSAYFSQEQSELVFDLFYEQIASSIEIEKSKQSIQSKQIAIDQLQEQIMNKLHFTVLTKKQRLAKTEYHKQYSN